MGYNVHDVLKKIVVYYTKINQLKMNFFCYDLKLLPFLKRHNKKSTRNLYIFKCSYLFKNDKNFKNMSCIGTNRIIFL
jgi:hypothetical protein